MSKKQHVPGSWDFDRWLVKMVRKSWQTFYNLEKVLLRRIFIKDFQPRKDDVCVVTYMRSGTTKVQMMLYQLMTEGDMNFRHFSNVSPLLEDAIFSGKKMDDMPSPRIFKTHGDYKYFPKKNAGRIIYVVRNGMDVASSMYHYYKDYNMPDLEWDRFLDKTFMDRISWFRHVEAWLENKHGFNVCFIKYESANEYPRETIEKLAKFLGIPLTEELIARVTERCSFAFMKQHQAKFGRPQVEANKPDTQFIRRGESDKGQLEFNATQRKKFSALYDKHLGRFNLGYNFSVTPEKVNEPSAV
ncbi:sulfotransferase domain-containing protein [Chitinophaga sp.]|uniref:sulfotransferase domain-containing protein n=1 Tax=Chitinophaga sp. TaxID=1869181 RepID=UPI0031DA11F2